MADNKCRSCGQFAGRGHRCPTITAPQEANHGLMVGSGVVAVGLDRSEVEGRVEAARAVIGRSGPREQTEFMMTTMAGDILIDAADVDDEDTQYAYSNGQCLALAFALYKRGFEMSAVVVDPEGDDPVWDGVHYVAWHPDGFHLDIRGQYRDREAVNGMLERFHGGAMIPLNEWQVRELVENAEEAEALPPQCWDGAEITATRLLGKHGVRELGERENVPVPPELDFFD